jgi:glucose/arabinose dehydrogenase/Ca2+-binding RTX toxin-like protein
MRSRLARGALVGVIGLAIAAPAASAEPCSPLACSEILVELPYALDFSSDHGKILDANGGGTGFTHVDQPTNGTGYIPANLLLDHGAGELDVTTTAGLNFQDINSLDNALGVGIDAPSQVTRIEATLDDPPAGTESREQAGVWFGNDEDNYVKLVAYSGGGGPAIEFRIEESSGTSGSGVLQSPVLDLAGKSVTLSLIADPSDTTIQASYEVEGDPPVTLGTLVAPPQFFSFDGARIDPEIGTDSFGGIMTSHRNGPAPLTYSFDRFAVTKEADVVPPAPTVLPGGIAFEKALSFVPMPTSIAYGPDGRLYVSELFGTIHALTLNEDKQAIADQVITTLGERLTLGLTVDPASTPGNVVLWASHSSPSLFEGAPNSGIVSRLSGPGFADRQDVITGLPRAIANHGTNSIHFGPDGRLYIAQGGNTGAGAPNTSVSEFGDMQEQPLSAALLVADVASPGFDGSCDNSADIFGPPPCDVTTFSTGLRNMYDFVFHSNGSIYGPDNGLGVTGTFPPSPTAPCLGMASTVPWDADPPGHNPGQQPDLLVRLQQGAYYGHPNPHRDECVFKDGSYQGVAPPPNYQPPVADLGDHRSANGTIEYTSADAHCGSLQGDLLIANYSVGDDLTRVELSQDGNSAQGVSSLIGGFNEPLPLAQDPDGTVYVGEFAAGTVTALVPVNAGCWTERETSPAEVLDAGGADVGGKLYVVGGKDSAQHLSSVRVFDPATGSWGVASNLPGPAVENPAVAADDGKLYAFGGSTAAFSGAVDTGAVLDPGTGAWTPLPPMPTPRGGATAQAIGGKLYVAGGIGADGASLDTVEVFDPSAGPSGAWAPATPMSTRRDNAGSALLDGKLYVFGGRTRNADGSTVNGTLDSTEAYDPATGSWEPRASMPTGRRAMAVGTLNGRAQLIGGERKGANDVFAENEEYDPVSDSWRLLTPMRTPRHGATAGTIGNAIYVAGGGVAGGTSFSSLNEAFSFVKVSPPVDPTDPGPPPTLAPKSRCGGRAASIVGTSGADDLNGTGRADVIAGLGGNDRIRGRRGNDRICGGDGADLLLGGPGSDRLFGGAGLDRLFGGIGHNRCLGGGGHNRFKACQRQAGGGAD